MHGDTFLTLLTSAGTGRRSRSNAGILRMERLHRMESLDLQYSVMLWFEMVLMNVS